MPFASLCTILLGLLAPPQEPANNPLATVAERSNFRATATSEEVVALGKRLAAESRAIQVSEIGKTTEGRPIPLWIVSNPPVTTPEAARKAGKIVVAIIANIHAGEVDGKEAIGILAREIGGKFGHPLLKDLVLVVVPNYNPDGNDQFSKTNRPGQVGPADGMGKRSNGQGLDLNRDFVKLDAPETRALVALLNKWNPEVFLDLHTTNGSYHRYTLTYQGPLNPNGSAKVVEYTRKSFLPSVGKELKAKGGWESFFYGNFEDDHKVWSSYPDWPRFGTNYVGLRNRIAILSESYSYAPYKDRIMATRDFTRECLAYAAAHKDEIRRLVGMTQSENDIARPGGPVAISSEAKAFPQEVTALGYVEETKDGRKVATKEPKDYTVKHVQDFVAKATVKRPESYLIPAKYAHAIETLQRHGLKMVELREDISLDLTAYKVTKVDRAARPYEGHFPVKLETEPHKVTKLVEAGTVMIRTMQPLGNLAVYLLEPGSDDNLATWGMFDDGLVVGSDFPVMRIDDLLSFPISNGPVRPLPEARATKKPFNQAAMAAMAGGGRRGRGGAVEWIDDQHWIVSGDPGMTKVDALTGRSSIWVNSVEIGDAIKKIPELAEERVYNLAGAAYRSSDPKRTGGYFEHKGDLYYASFDGKTAVRLTKSPGKKELVTFSPDGKCLAFVRDNDLFVVDIATQTERALTKGGTDKKRNGKADWVYYEEIFNRNWKAYWWSPDSANIGFLQIDDAPVKNHEVINDDIDSPRKVELTPYPRAGDPNPTVRFGLASATEDRPIRWLEISEGAKGDRLVSAVSWWPDGKTALVSVQDRTQTFLDLTRVPVDPKAPTDVLLRQTTKAWVEPPDGPFVLPDGTFLLTSERTGWKHLDLYGADGKLIRPITSGEWEVRSVEHFDPKARVVFVTGTRDNPVATNLYKVSIDDGTVDRLTHGAGGHAVKLNPSATLFTDTWSDTNTPPESALFDIDGKRLRTLNRASHQPTDDYKLGPRERVQIKASDGFVLEGELTLPPDLDPKKLYPVWFTTYGGPHSPSISDSWAGGKLSDQALAADGIIVFRVDPRSASGKGAAATWTAYQKLGVQELKDIKDAINWLKERPYVDGSRIGMTGHSYGGFMTAYAMTHSDLFSCGIAGAPVTDWHDYDSIYTERFMRTPQENPEGYKESSVVEAAKDLKGHLMIIHGMMDDNVSVRNSMRLIEALQDADKDFEVMIYPTSRHGIFSRHYSRLMREFIRKHLGGPKDR